MTELSDWSMCPDFDPLPHIPVVEMVSEDEMSEVESLTSHYAPKWVQITLITNNETKNM